MKDLIEVRFEAKVTVGSEKLPKGLTEPLTKIAEQAIPLIIETFKKYLGAEGE